MVAWHFKVYHLLLGNGCLQLGGALTEYAVKDRVDVLEVPEEVEQAGQFCFGEMGGDIWIGLQKG